MKRSYLCALVANLRTTVGKAAVRNSFTPVRRMATVKDHIPHTQRTANDPRQTGLFDATISRIDQINSKIRLLRLSLAIDEVGLQKPIEARNQTKMPQ